MKNRLLFLSAGLMFLLNPLRSQTIEEKLGDADFFKKDNFIYIYNVEDSKILNIKKYDMSLSPVASYSKQLDGSIAEHHGEGMFYVAPLDSFINSRFQFSKEKKIQLKPYLKDGQHIQLDYNFKEILNEKTQLPYSTTGLDKSQDGKPGTGSYNPINDEILEKEIKLKNSITEVGQLITFSGGKDSSSIQLANYKEGGGNKKYQGFYLLKYVNEKVKSFKKFPFLAFQDVNNQSYTYMEFYPDLVIKNGDKYLVPFSQKTHRAMSYPATYGNSQTMVTVDEYHIMGVGVIEVNTVDMSIKTIIQDRKGTRVKLHDEYIVNFKATGLNSFAIMTKNYYTHHDTFKALEFYIYTQDGEKVSESGKHVDFLLLDPKTYIKFVGKSSGYSLSKLTL